MGYASLQGLPEQVIESAIRGTEVSGVSFNFRLVFSCAEHVTTGAFIPNHDAMELDELLLPSQNTLIAWVSRLRARHSQLRAFRIIIEYDLMEADLPDDNVILAFEYHEAAEDAGVYPRPSNGEDKDQRFRNLDAITDQCRYQLYPDLVRACYDALLRDAEVLRQQAVLEGDNAQAALPRGNGAAVVTDGAD